MLHQALKRQKISVCNEEVIKLLVCDADNMVNGFKLAAYFRKQGINTAISSFVPENCNGYDEVICVNASVVERYGI